MPPTSASTARNAAVAAVLMSGCRPGFSSAVLWMRCSDPARRPSSRRATSRSVWSTNGAAASLTRASCGCVFGLGLVTSRTSASWLVIILRAASSRAPWECTAAAPSASVPVAPSSSLRSPSHCCETATPPTSSSTAMKAAAAASLMSGLRPGFSSGVACVRLRK
eukprot:scaffold103565_cov60-Phaeocystis_antarctica.AAC.2